MVLISDIERHFNTKDLYEVLDTTRNATPDQIKKAYRKASLKIHPDRVDESQKEEATKRFQVLAQVHYVLGDEERRKMYDDHGIIANEDSLDSEADWSAYWRILFPKITERDIQGFLNKYIGSSDEESDLIRLYEKYQGDLDKLYETHISYDEERTVNDLNSLIEEGKIKPYINFTHEPEAKKARRIKKVIKEANHADKATASGKNTRAENFDDLASMIQKRSQNSFDSMIAGLEAKYSKKPKGLKRKHSDS